MKNTLISTGDEIASLSPFWLYAPPVALLIALGSGVATVFFDSAVRYSETRYCPSFSFFGAYMLKDTNMLRVFAWSLFFFALLIFNIISYWPWEKITVAVTAARIVSPISLCLLWYLFPAAPLLCLSDNGLTYGMQTSVGSHQFVWRIDRKWNEVSRLSLYHGGRGGHCGISVKFNDGYVYDFDNGILFDSRNRKLISILEGMNGRVQTGKVQFPLDNKTFCFATSFDE